ncbi:hypothetical protein [Nocardioides sp. 503]|uniref:hypothetical protein n=1 Tax=Nocardioides sp. 503 TaxID=2508326 RepID=UPI0010704F88|nr:hypothetical protein [Nocardioides sp. 503]
MPESSRVPSGVRRIRLSGWVLIAVGVAVSFVGALVLSVPPMEWAGRATCWTGVAVLVGAALCERRLRGLEGAS